MTWNGMRRRFYQINMKNIIPFFFITIFFLLCDATNSSQQACKNGGIWKEKQQKCECDFKWKGKVCGLWKFHKCYFDDGYLYRGRLSMTETGARCAPWTLRSNLKAFPIGKNGIGNHNYCRNPDRDKKGLWCYVYSEKYVEYCNATVCPDSYKTEKFLEPMSMSSDNTTSNLAEPLKPQVKDGNKNDTVQFLYGPLIIGVCIGVVSLLVLIGLAEYLRRKGFLKKKTRKLRNKKKHTRLRNSNTKLDTVPPTGGIITFNLDTGRQTRHSANVQGADHTSQIF